MYVGYQRSGLNDVDDKEAGGVAVVGRQWNFLLAINLWVR
jgi:hypothetical protein